MQTSRRGLAAPTMALPVDERERHILRLRQGAFDLKNERVAYPPIRKKRGTDGAPDLGAELRCDPPPIFTLILGP